jgi:predicted NUDIX family NTP pyrophosphohydrolase
MPKRSAGTLLYRKGTEELEVLLVHPSGNYNRNKPWSIPKGEPDEDEGEGPEQAARRETLEETGVEAGILVSLGCTFLERSHKQIDCFAGPAPKDAAPFLASWEVDQADFVPLSRARLLLHPDQHVFLDRLLAHLQARATDSGPS